MNSPLAKAKPILIRSDEPGTTALNAYHVIGQILGIFAQAARLNTDPELSRHWADAQDSLLANVGNLFDFWNAIKHDASYGLAPKESELLASRIESLSRRISQVNNAISQWTPSCRVASTLLLCEARWQQILNGFKDQYGDHGVVLNKLLADSRGRVRSVKALLVAQGKPLPVPVLVTDPTADELIDINID